MQLPGDRYSFSVKPDRAAVKKKKIRLLVVFIILAVAAGIGYMFISGGISTWFLGSQKDETAPQDEQKSFAQLWEMRDYVTINERCGEVLEEDPLSKRHLLYNGFSYFYRGANQYSPEDQLPLFRKAVVNLRKLLVLDSPPEEGKIHYVLGKTYYHKGRFFLDLSVHHLKRAAELDYSAADLYRYLGLALGEMGNYEESIDYFLTAAEEQPDAILYMTIGQTYYKMGRNEKALDFLSRSVQVTEEIAVEQRARFLLGKIYMDMDMLEKAKDQYEVILSNDPKSADAHFHLGEIYELQEDNVKARAEWRSTLEIEPSHYGALLKLY